MKPAKIELLSKVIAWRCFSMLYGFAVAFAFTGNAAESAGIVMLTGATLTFLQWGFEILWDKHARHRIRHVLSRQHGRIGWLVWWRRSPRTISMDEHKPGTHGGEEGSNSDSSKNAG